MASISKSERLLNLVSFLLKARRPVTLQEILTSVVGYREDEGELASLERRFERDKAALRELGVPLLFMPDGGGHGAGYVIPRDACFLPDLKLNSSEVALLALAGRFLMAGAAGPVSEALQSALRKLQFDSPIPGDIRETAEEHFLFHRLREEADGIQQQNLRALTNAVLARQAVTFLYRGIEHDRSERRSVNPYGIGFHEGHWYMVGQDLKREAIRVFRTDRIHGDIKRKEPRSIGPEFEIPANFRVQDHVGVPRWLFSGNTETLVRIRLDADVAFMVKLRPAPGDEWEDLPDGGGILTRKATHPGWLLHWALSLGSHAEILDPPDFRARVAETLRGIAATHSRKTTGGAE